MLILLSLLYYWNAKLEMYNPSKAYIIFFPGFQTAMIFWSLLLVYFAKTRGFDRIPAMLFVIARALVSIVVIGYSVFMWVVYFIAQDTFDGNVMALAVNTDFKGMFERNKKNVQISLLVVFAICIIYQIQMICWTSIIYRFVDDKRHQDLFSANWFKAGDKPVAEANIKPVDFNARSIFQRIPADSFQVDHDVAQPEHVQLAEVRQTTEGKEIQPETIHIINGSNADSEVPQERHHEAHEIH
jgi:signal transduction histidine kinase